MVIVENIFPPPPPKVLRYGSPQISHTEATLFGKFSPGRFLRRRAYSPGCCPVNQGLPKQLIYQSFRIIQRGYRSISSLFPRLLSLSLLLSLARFEPSSRLIHFYIHPMHPPLPPSSYLLQDCQMRKHRQ